MSPRTIDNVIADFAAEINQQRCSLLPEMIGIDEIHLGRKPHCVLTDLEKGLHFCILPDNYNETIKDALSRYPNPHEVTAVAMDMTGRYREVVEAVLPTATVVIDLFHVLQLADDCRESVRIAAAKLSAGTTRATLRSRKGFWDNVEDSDGWGGVQDSLFGPHLPSLSMAHEVYTEFCAILRDSKRSWECTQRYDDWMARLPVELFPHFQPLVDSVAKFRDEISAYVELGLTNGFTEGNNSSIRNQFRRAPHSSFRTFSAALAARAERKHQRQVANSGPDENDDANTTDRDPSVTAGLIDTLNAIHEVKESRPWWRSHLLAVALAIALGLLLTGVLIIVMYGPVILHKIAPGSATLNLWNLAQWPAAAVLLILALLGLYRFAPDIQEQQWKWLLPGSIVAAAVWMVVSVLFKIYIRHFSHFGLLYGSLGTLIILMFWFYMSGFAILVGAEINSVLEDAAAHHGVPGAKRRGQRTLARMPL